jgi:hypothetical protein
MSLMAINRDVQHLTPLVCRITYTSRVGNAHRIFYVHIIKRLTEARVALFTLF